MQVNWIYQVDSRCQEKKFVNGYKTVFLEQLVAELTREQAILDLVMCNEADLVSELEVKELLGGSDYNRTEFTLQFEREKLESDVAILQLSR
eukprot:g15254.t1